MVAGWVLFGIGMAGLVYTIGLGIYFYNKHGKKPKDIGAINKEFIEYLERLKTEEAYQDNTKDATDYTKEGKTRTMKRKILSGSEVKTIDWIVNLISSFRKHLKRSKP